MKLHSSTFFCLKEKDHPNRHRFSVTLIFSCFFFWLSVVVVVRVIQPLPSSLLDPGFAGEHCSNPVDLQGCKIAIWMSSFFRSPGIGGLFFLISITCTSFLGALTSIMMFHPPSSCFCDNKPRGATWNIHPSVHLAVFLWCFFTRKKTSIHCCLPCCNLELDKKTPKVLSGPQWAGIWSLSNG